MDLFKLWKFLDANLSLGSSSGIVLAVPISEEQAASGVEIEKATLLALREAQWVTVNRTVIKEYVNGPDFLIVKSSRKNGKYVDFLNRH